MKQAPAACLLIAGSLLVAGCFVTTDENLWKQRKEAGPDVDVADITVADISWQEAAEQGPWPDGPRPEGPDVDGPTADKSLVDAPPQPDTNKDPNGTPCSAGSSCSTGHCMDNVCCNAACGGACEACNLAGQVGTCSPVAAGTDPDDDCAPEAVSTCGRDGLCNGSGGCRTYAAGTECAAPVCSSSTASSVKKCSATGSCASSPEVACTPYRCDSSTGTCYTSCSSDLQCYLYKCNTATSACYTKCTSVSQCQTGLKCIGNGKCK